MSTDTDPLNWPELPDEAAVALHDLLLRFMTEFESRYFGQIHRHYQGQRPKDLTQADLFATTAVGNPPF